MFEEVLSRSIERSRYTGALEGRCGDAKMVGTVAGCNSDIPCREFACTL